MAKSSLARFAAQPIRYQTHGRFGACRQPHTIVVWADDWNGRCLPSARATARRPLTAEMLINQHWIKWDATMSSDFQDRPHVAAKPVGKAYAHGRDNPLNKEKYLTHAPARGVAWVAGAIPVNGPK